MSSHSPFRMFTLFVLALSNGQHCGANIGNTFTQSTVVNTYYRKRGSASYIVREVLLVRERERERERYRERER